MENIQDLLDQKGFRALTKSDRLWLAGAGENAVLTEKGNKLFIYDNEDGEPLLEVIDGESGDFVHFTQEAQIKVVIELI